MSNILPIRSQIEINAIINNSQQALASLVLVVVNEKKQGLEITDRDHRDKVYRIILLRAYLQVLLDQNGNVTAFYAAATNTIKFNQILDGLVFLSKLFGGPGIPMLGQVNLPLYFYPSSAGQIINPPNVLGTAFGPTIANSPSVTVDSVNPLINQGAFWFVEISGSNAGEGSRTSMVVGTWRGSTTPTYNEYGDGDCGGITSPVTIKVELVGGVIQLNAYVTTSGWTIKGFRLP